MREITSVCTAMVGPDSNSKLGKTVVGLPVESEDSVTGVEVFSVCSDWVPFWMTEMLSFEYCISLRKVSYVC